MPDDPTGTPEGTPAPPAPPAPPSGTPARTFTQAEVDAFNADTRRKAEETAQRKLLESLGITDVDSGKAIIAAAKAAEDAAKSELQRAQEERDLATARAAQAEARAQNVLIQTRVENALRDAGINPARIEGAIKLAALGDVKVTDSGALEGIESVVDAVKSASPEWFGAPGKPFSAPDASGGGSAPVDLRTASAADYTAALAKYGVRPPSTGISY